MKKLVRMLTIFAVAALISFATGAAAAPNTFDADGNLCVGIPTEKIGDPMELWAGVGTEGAGTLVGYITFDSENVIINLTDLDNDGIPDMYPWVATAVHIHFASELDGIPVTPVGNPIPGQFECNIEQCENYIVIEQNVPVIVIPNIINEGDTVGAIHLAVERDYSDVDGLADSLPDGTVQMSVEHPQPDSYVDMTLAGAGDLSGVWDGWCVDDDTPISEDTVYDAYLYSSYDTATVGSLPFEHPENFPKVNYLLNTFSAGDMVQPVDINCEPAISCGAVAPLQALTKGDIQRAIWVLIDDAPYSTVGLGPWSQNRVNAILCDVNANGEGFIPGCDEETVFIAVPVENNDIQMIIAQMVISSLELECIAEEETAWGDGKDGMSFDGAQWGTYFEYDYMCVPE